jgi:hypothetical protein
VTKPVRLVHSLPVDGDIHSIHANTLRSQHGGQYTAQQQCQYYAVIGVFLKKYAGNSLFWIEAYHLWYTGPALTLPWAYPFVDSNFSIISVVLRSPNRSVHTKLLLFFFFLFFSLHITLLYHTQCIIVNIICFFFPDTHLGVVNITMLRHYRTAHIRRSGCPRTLPRRRCHDLTQHHRQINVIVAVTW